MKIVSFNINGVRARPHQLQQLVASHQPDIVGLQETKVQDDDFPREIFDQLGYHVSYFGQKGHYGVALMSRQPAEAVQLGFPGEDADAQRRFIAGRFRLADGSTLSVLNGYFPQGEGRNHPTKFPNKRRFYADLLAYLQQYHQPGEQLVVMGDMNVAPLDLDIGIGAHNAKRWLRTGKCSFLPEERDWFNALLDWGLVDSFRALNPEQADALSWFDYRSRGFEQQPRHGLRIDHLLITPTLMANCREVGIDYQIRGMEKPSDHCPVWVNFDL